ncbi:MAG TPA: HAD-IIIA family hydrolase [Methanomassiliicoccales archaeon]|nr:HAD-IIIA family hydrolase [Methanomassiliicoccales archaeon]
MRDLVRSELEESASITGSVDPESVLRIAEVLTEVFRTKHKVILFGNGGSAADAQHIAAEFSGKYLFDREPLNAVALTNLSSITAIGNDYSYESVFERQVRAGIGEGDAVVGISTSGNSKNVLKAVQAAESLGARTIGFSGSGGRLKEEVELALVVPSRSPPRVQEAYMAAAHVMCGLVERSLFGRSTVFIDRDNTIAKDVPYCPRPEEMKLLPGAGEAIKRLNEAGLLIIVITNQSGVARGYFTEDTLKKINEKMKADLAKKGAKVDAIYFCPHLPDAGCKCRKPEVGMVMQALSDFPIDLTSSYVVGDSEHDIELGRRIGAKQIRVTNSFTLLDAAKRIVKERKASARGP